MSPARAVASCLCPALPCPALQCPLLVLWPLASALGACQKPYPALTHVSAMLCPTRLHLPLLEGLCFALPSWGVPYCLPVTLFPVQVLKLASLSVLM